MRCPDLKQLVLFIIFRNDEKVVRLTTKTRMLCNMKQDNQWKLWKANHDNVKFCNKNVNVVEKNYVEAQKYISYNEEEARVLLADRVCYHDDTYILTFER